MKHTTDVYHRGVLVGSLFENEYHQLAFSYADSWLRSGFSVSPFSLPLKEGVFVPNSGPFNGLFGVFSHSSMMMRLKNGHFLLPTT